MRQVLKECNKSAKTGYKIASAQEKNLNRALASAQEKVQSTIIDFNSSPCYAPEATELLEVQLVEIRDAFNRLSFAFKEDLQNLRENLSQFSITLFGRTMAGKSTLMEILTEGDGSNWKLIATHNQGCSEVHVEWSGNNRRTRHRSF